MTNDSNNPTWLPEFTLMVQGKTNPHRRSYYLLANMLNSITPSNDITNRVRDNNLRLFTGDKDIRQFNNLLQDYKQYSKEIGVADGYKNQCARWVNDQLKAAGFNKTSKGNAWTKPAGTRIIFDGRLPSRTKNLDRQSLIDYYMQAAANFQKQWNPDLLDPSKTYSANMYYAVSPFGSRAYVEGNGAGSHIGLVKNIEGKWYVDDEFGGKVYRTPIEHLIGNKNTAGIITLFQDE